MDNLKLKEKFKNIITPLLKEGGVIKKSSHFKNLKENKFLGVIPKIQNSQIIFKGKNNILYCEEGVKIVNSKISFNCDNSLVYLSSSSHSYRLNINTFNNNIVYIGKNNYFNPGFEPVKIICSEEKHVFIGNNNLFSFNIWFRNADAHLIYDCGTKRRINQAESIYIADHIWLGQNVLILKGSKIHSGSVIGANSVVVDELLSNSTYAGVSAKLIRKDTFWLDCCSHAWEHKNTADNMVCGKDEFIYDNDENYISFNFLEQEFEKNKSAQERLEYLKTIAKNENKNRFCLK